MFALRSFAHQAGLPITAIDVEQAAELNHLFRFQDSGGPVSFPEFCEQNAPIASELLNGWKYVASKGLAFVNHFPHPLYRHMKEHLPVRLYEIFSALRAMRHLKPGESVSEDYILNECGLKVIYRRTEAGLLFVGPLFVQSRLGEGLDRAYFTLITDVLDRFRDEVDVFWENSDLTERAYKAIYTTDHLVNLAFARSKQLQSLAQSKLESIVELDSVLGNGLPDSCGSLVASTATIKLIAGLAAAQTGQHGGSLQCKAFGTSALRREVNVEIQPDGWTVTETNNVPSELFSIGYASEMNRVYQGWGVFVSESLAQLRHWLTHRSSQGMEVQPADETEKFGRRLTRFLAEIFDAYECTLYRVSFSNGRPALATFGAFSADPNGEQRLKIMQAHMETLAETGSQSRSISYRCMNDNTVQYCQYFDYATHQAIPAEQTISFPANEEYRFWGHSACAIPIRTNGILWGVCQLIGRRPHAFPEFIRAKAEDACNIIGSHLSRTDLIGAVVEISQTMSNSELGSVEKRTVIEKIVAKMFGAKTYAIIRSDFTADINVFLESGRDDLRIAAERSEDHDYVRPLLDFSTEEKDTWSGIIGSNKFRSRFPALARRKFYENSSGDLIYLAKISWSAEKDSQQIGVAVLTFSHELKDQENWREVINFACRYVSTITGSLYNSDIWERKLREKIGHELSKTSGNLNESVAKLRKLQSRESSGSVKSSSNFEIEAIIGDLSRHSKALDRYVHILATHRDANDFDDDPRLYLIREMKGKWSEEKQRSTTSIREIYNSSFFGKAKLFSQKGIELPKLDPSLDFKIEMDELCLSEVMTTLADNILKYTRPGTQILIREDSTSNMKGFQISNIGLRLEPSELRRIFQIGVRGMRAYEFLPDQGSGYGLWFAQKAMHIWGGGLRHSQRQLSQEDPQWAWQDFTVSFRSAMIRRGGGR